MFFVCFLQLFFGKKSIERKKTWWQLFMALALCGNFITYYSKTVITVKGKLCIFIESFKLRTHQNFHSLKTNT